MSSPWSPLGGDKFASQLLAPIKPEIFYELVEEGWPIDLLMRVLIERIGTRRGHRAGLPPQPRSSRRAIPRGQVGVESAAAAVWRPPTASAWKVMVNDPLRKRGRAF